VKTRYLPAALVLTLVAAPLGVVEGQQANPRVVQALSKQTGAGSPAACKAGFAAGGSVGDAIADLGDASKQKDATKRDKKFAEAQQKLTAEAEKDGGKNASAWLYLGRAYLYRGDIVGADQAFTKAEALAPDCKEDIERYRQVAWTPLLNDGIDHLNAARPDSALVLFRDANTIYRGKPNGFYNLAAVYTQRGQPDSAIVYFQKAADIAVAANLPEDRNSATLNLGVLLARAKRYDESIAALERFRGWSPSDTTGAQQLHRAYCAAGKNEKAAALEKEAKLTSCSVAGGDTKELANKGIALFNDKKFAEAAAVFTEVYAKQPFNHDALLNQAQAYYGLKDGPKLVEAAGKFTALEPMHELGLQLLELGYRMQKQTDKQLAVIGRRRTMPAKVESTGLLISPTELTLTLAATGRDAKDAKDQAVKATPVALVFEILGADGSVVSTQDVTVPALAPGATQELKVTSQATGINGWRYKVK
jgi:tetratricopeptide (TPR) repeat protein